MAIKQKFCKPYFYPIAIVASVEPNDISEIVTVVVRKSNGEKLRRHVTDLILLESRGSPNSETNSTALDNASEVPNKETPKRPRRAAAIRSINRIKGIDDSI